MSYFRGCPVLLFEKDSNGYLTEKRRTGQTGKSRKRIFDKIQNNFLQLPFEDVRLVGIDQTVEDVVFPVDVEIGQLAFEMIRFQRPSFPVE